MAKLLQRKTRRVLSAGALLTLQIAACVLLAGLLVGVLLLMQRGT